MFARLGKIDRDHPWGVLAAWVIVAAALHVLAPSWDEVANDGDLEQLPAYTTTSRAAKLNAQAFPDDTAKSQIVLVAARSEEPLQPKDRQFALALARKIEAIPDLPLAGDVWTPQTPVIGQMLKSPGDHAEEIVIRLTNDFMALDNVRVMEAVMRVVDAERDEAPQGLDLGVTGAAAIGADMLAAAKESLHNTELTTIALVTITLLVIYRSAWLVLIPLLSIGVAVLVSIDLLAILAKWSIATPDPLIPFRIFTTTRLFVVVLLFGAGTDFCLFLIARFRELRTEGRNQADAVGDSVGRVGSAISASAFTTIVGLGMMGFADFGKFAYSGPAIAVSLAVMLAVCLTVAPALLATKLGTKVTVSDGGPLDKGATGPDDSDLSSAPGYRLWSRIADGVLARPVAILAGSLLVAAPFIWHGLNVEVTYDLFSELPPTATSRQGAELLQRHFPPGETAPMTVLAKLPAGMLSDDDGKLRIAKLSKRIHDLEGVSKVRSLYRPTGDAPGAVSLFSAQGITALAVAGSPLAKEAFVSSRDEKVGDVTRLFVTLDDPPFSVAAVDTVGRMEKSLDQFAQEENSSWRDGEFEYQGPTPGIRDLGIVTLADRKKIEILVSLAVFAVILALLRRPVVCLYLIATVIAGYFVTLGGVSLLMEWIYGVDYPGLDWKAPVFLFVILVAVGQDYNIFLVHRVYEEEERHGPLRGLRRALIQTGGIITSCGLIMAATFASLLTGSLRSMIEMGTALSLGIMLDTFFVRTILVPAFLAILARREERQIRVVPPVLPQHAA